MSTVSDNSEIEAIEFNDATLDKNEILVNFIKTFPILLTKSQLPDAKLQKNKAIVAIKNHFLSTYAIAISEKQLCKKILNMKQNLKKKIDINQTGNKKIVLNNWEKELSDLLQVEDNPVFSRVPGHVSSSILPANTPPPTGNQASPSTSSTTVRPPLSTTKPKGKKRSCLDEETDETRNLCTGDSIKFCAAFIFRIV